MSKIIRWKIYGIPGAYHKVGPQVFAERISRRKYLEDTDEEETQVQKLFPRPHLPSQKTFLCLRSKAPMTFFVLTHFTGLGHLYSLPYDTKEKER